jgi:hypothetical protein
MAGLRRFLVVVLTVALGASLWASCAEAADLSASRHEDMACCKDGQLCGPSGTPRDCCQASAPTSQFTSVAKVEPRLSPVTFVAALVAQPILVPAGSQIGLLIASERPPGGKSPTYLRLSSLRI